MCYYDSKAACEVTSNYQTNVVEYKEQYLSPKCSEVEA